MTVLTQQLELSVPIAAVKQFGPWRPEYEILSEAQPENGKRMVKIVLVRTGEELDYPLEAILLDREAE